MPDASGLLALGQALDQYLIGEFSPPPGTQTALGFLPGIAVNPSSFAPTGVVNPLAVHTFLNSVANVLGPVVDGRFAGFMSAHQVYGMVIDVASPLDPPGSPAADAFLSMKNTARSAFGASPVKQLVSVPLNWYDAAGTDGWSRFTTTTVGTAGAHATTTTGPDPAPPDTTPGETPPVVVPPTERFAKIWRWRTLDEAAIADVLVPSLEAVVDEPEPVVIREHRVRTRSPLVRDHRGIDLSEVAVVDRGVVRGSATARSSVELRLGPAARTSLQGRALGFAPAAVAGLAAEPQVAAAPVDVPDVPVLATAPRRQLLAALGQDEPAFARAEDVVVRSTSLAHLVELQAPVLVQEIDDDTETSSTQSVQSHELTLSLEYCFVQISRDAWWNDAILRMPRWYAPGCRAGAISTGTSGGGPPLGLPIALVLTRNVSVSGRWSEADRAAATSHTSFGPWSTRESAMSQESQTGTATLTMPGWQVVAVVCALLPPLAPADDPALGPVADPAPTA